MLLGSDHDLRRRARPGRPDGHHPDPPQRLPKPPAALDRRRRQGAGCARGADRDQGDGTHPRSLIVVSRDSLLRSSPSASARLSCSSAFKDISCRLYTRCTAADEGPARRKTRPRRPTAPTCRRPRPAQRWDQRRRQRRVRLAPEQAPRALAQRRSAPEQVQRARRRPFDRVGRKGFQFGSRLASHSRLPGRTERSPMSEGRARRAAPASRRSRRTSRPRQHPKRAGRSTSPLKSAAKC
jgi:hypothetical protein